MNPINPHLFVYGTLLSSNNSYAAYLQQHCTLLDKGKFKGSLYDIGEYPGALAANDEQYVYGNIYLIDEPAGILKVTDDYEGVGGTYPHPQEYTRKEVEIITGTGSVPCWIYLYNLPVDAFKQIGSGNYPKYLKEKKARF